MTKREQIRELLGDDDVALLLEPDMFDAAIVGLAERCGHATVIAYSRQACLDVLIADGMSEEDALEWFEYNTIGAWAGEGTPIFVTELPQ